MTDTQTPSVIFARYLNGSGGSSEIPEHALSGTVLELSNAWVHMDYQDAGVQQWLMQGSGLNEIASNGLLSEETRPRALVRGDNLLLTLRGINLNPNENPEDMVSLRIWTDGQRLLSTRRRSLLSTQDVADDLAAGSGPQTVPALLVALVERIVDRMQNTIEAFEETLFEAEEQILGGTAEGVRTRLVKLRQQTISIRRYLAPQREAMSKLCAENFVWLDEMQRLRLRDATDRLIRYIETLDEVRDRAALAQEELSNQLAEQLSERSYFFTVVAVVFLPLGFLTGLLGINVGGLPGVDSPHAFWFVVGFCAVVGVGLWWLLKRRRWL